MTERAFEFHSGDLRIEALLGEATKPRFSALVLHPHPRFGGDMQNYVVGVLCDALASAGATTMRFNFRGVGKSEGAFDNGDGEAADAVAAAAALRALSPDIPLLLAGYSFGAMIAAADAAEIAPAALILVSPPVAFSPLRLNEAPGTPVLLITGDRDPVSPAQAVTEVAVGSRRAVIVPGADHSWWPGVEPLAKEVVAFIDALDFHAGPDAELT